MAQKDQKKKRPTALKRDIQNEKRRLVNKSFKTKAHSTLRTFNESLASKDSEAISTNLNAVFSVMDKGVKRGVFKPNKADRTKARAAAKVAALSS